jgi:hypothetical protein
MNDVATNTEAVFLVIPAEDGARTVAIQREVSAAASTLAEKGAKVAKFVLGRDAKDYKEVSADVGAPAVLVKGLGKSMRVVDGTNATKEALLKAYVSASRFPSAKAGAGCGAGGCGPKGCAIKPQAGYDMGLPK